MLKFNLFRFKVFEKEQGTIWREGVVDRGELLKRAINSNPSARLWGNTIGSIGDVDEIDGNGIYFRFGKVRKTKEPQFEDGHFFDQIFERAPYTHVVLDWKLEVCAIAKQSQVAQKTESIARSLCRLLKLSNFARENGLEFEISQINDPEDFVSTIKRAHAVKKFIVSFSRPNSFDADEAFEKPIQRLLQELNGKEGEATIQTDGDLDRDGIVSIAQAAAAQGEKVRARLADAPGSQPKMVRLEGNPISIDHGNLENKEERINLIETIRKFYRKVRHGE